MSGKMSTRPGTVLGIVPARGGSKRLPGKNTRLLAGKMLLQWTAEAALACPELDRVILSTDCPDIAAKGKDCGLQLPFLRPAELATDQSTDREVLTHALDWFRENENWIPWAVVYLRPTTPFKTAAMLTAAIQLLAKSGADSVRSMTPVSGVHHPYWMYQKDASGLCESLMQENADSHYQSQMLPPVYRLNGVVDIIRTEVILLAGPLYGSQMQVLEIPEASALDIDTEIDWRYAEFLIQNQGHMDKNTPPKL